MTPTTPRLVLLHAFPLNRHMWAPQLELMPGATIAPDLYELGESIESWAIATLDTLGPGPLIVVGASMGGSCALEMARLAGDRIEALVLVGAKAGYRPEPKLRDAYIESLETEGLMGLWPDFQTLAFGAASDERFVSRVREMALEQRTEDLVSAVRAFHDRADLSQVVRSWTKPLLVVSGDRGTLQRPERAAALAAEAPNGELLVMNGCGHFPSMERPREFNNALLDFMGVFA